jgi:dynein heavy chain 1
MQTVCLHCPFSSPFSCHVCSYEERIGRVETEITARLRDQLGGAKSANEMFAIFSRFNALFIRPHIRGAIREYQTQLIQRVKEDIGALQQQFTIPYRQGHSRISRARCSIVAVSRRRRG